MKAAFGVVSHESLLRKLFHIGVEGKEWSLIHSLLKGNESVVKWEGSTTSSFKVRQDVRQGGILSTDLYKLYGNGQLQSMEELVIGCHIGEICCVAPTAADDMAVPAPNLTILQRLINVAVDNSKMEKYILQPTKSVILATLNEIKRGQEMESDINITMDGVKMPVLKEVMHMGIFRQSRVSCQSQY